MVPIVERVSDGRERGGLEDSAPESEHISPELVVLGVLFVRADGRQQFWREEIGALHSEKSLDVGRPLGVGEQRLVSDLDDAAGREHKGVRADVAVADVVLLQVAE